MLIVSYVVLGSITTAADTVSAAQKDITLQNEARLNTAITISGVSWTGQVDGTHDYLHFHITNNGSEIISNFNATDVYVAISGDAPVKYTFDAASSPGGHGNFGSRTWAYDSISTENINPGMLDPGEVMYIYIYDFSNVHPNYMVGATTSKGASAFFTA